MIPGRSPTRSARGRAPRPFDGPEPETVASTRPDTPAPATSVNETLRSITGGSPTSVPRAHATPLRPRTFPPRAGDAAYVFGSRPAPAPPSQLPRTRPRLRPSPAGHLPP